MATSNPAKLNWDELYRDLYGPGRSADIAQQFADQFYGSTGSNELYGTALQKMGDVGLYGTHDYEAFGKQAMDRSTDASQAGLVLANKLAAGQGPQMGSAAMVADPQKLGSLQAMYDPRLAGMITQNAPIQAALEAATRDMYRGLGENTLTQIGMGAGRGLNTGSSRRGAAEAIAGRGTLDRAADVAGQMYSDAYGRGVGVAGQYGLANQAAGNNMAQFNVQSNMQSQLANQAAQNAQMNANLQAQLASQQQAGNMFTDIQSIGAQLQQPTFGIAAQGPQLAAAAGEAQLNAPINRLQQYSNLMLPWLIPGSAPQQPKETWSQKLGNIGQAAAGIGSLVALSDRRLKDDIKPITDMGPLTLYRWNWKPEAAALGKAGHEVGFVAQEVAEVYPEYVHEHDGYLCVDYRGVFDALSKHTGVSDV